jgi:hypothetical protein
MEKNWPINLFLDQWVNKLFAHLQENVIKNFEKKM